MGPQRLRGDAITFKAPPDAAFAGAAEACARSIGTRAGLADGVAQRFAAEVRVGFERLAQPGPEPVSMVVHLGDRTLRADLGRTGVPPESVTVALTDRQRPV